MTTSLPAGRAEALDLRSLLLILVPLAALWVLIDHFTIESEAFSTLSLLAFGGFAVHYFLPLAARLPFFLGLSLAGIVAVLGVTPSAWIVGLGLGLIGICHLPVSWRTRIGLLIAAGAGLMALRADWLPAGVPAPVWPILGSMFMFRLAVYVYDLRHDPKLGSFWASLSYFFLLPNVCFPLFPVVDYKTFRTAYYNEDRHHIHREGLRWIYRGVMQLLLYRVVYQTLVLDPAAVANIADLAQYLIWPFLLYLRVSGQFHIIVGILRLFGFNLPETHHGYFLASSFTDFWRRINIYWKDFMMKLFYYPAFFALRKKGQVRALVAATVLVFVLTWLLHAYQWFWLRGSFMFTWNDGLFWAVLGAVVVVNALREWARPQPVSTRAMAWGPAFRLAGRTMLMFCGISVLWSLWSTESIETWLSLWSAAGRWPDEVRWTAVLCLMVPVGVGLAALGHARGWMRDRLSASPGREALIVAVAACLVVGSSYRVAGHLGPAGDMLLALRNAGLNQADAVALERGYYENLMAFDRFNGELWSLYSNRPVDWQVGLVEGGLAEPGDGLVSWVLRPSVEGRFKGALLRTNAWGLHDREYARTPAPGCVRIALLGASHAMGSGVEREQTFEALVEDRLNRERLGGRCYEILNFAVYGYSPLAQVEVLEERVLAFEPAVVLYVAHPEDSTRVARTAARLVTDGADLGESGLAAVVAEAGVSSDMPGRVVTQRLAPHGVRILEAFYRRLRTVSQNHGLCTGVTVLPMVPDMAYAVDVEEEKQAARRAGLVVLDLFGAYDVPNRNALWVAEWDAHPNADGHRLVADKLYARMVEHERALFGCRIPADARVEP